MSDARLAYDDPATLAEMTADGRAAQAALALPLAAAAYELVSAEPARQGKAPFEVPVVATHLARALYGDA